MIKRCAMILVFGGLGFSLYSQDTPSKVQPKDSIFNAIKKTTPFQSEFSFKDAYTNQMDRDRHTNPLNIIAGSVPGLFIKRGKNGPAVLDAVRLRGTTSLTGGNDPLIIVDGVLGGLEMLSSIYPSDVQNITILKDAFETAQYGSRGASGVIVVTTKKGVKGKTQVNYTGAVGVLSPYKTLNMLSGDEYRNLAKEKGWSILDKGLNINFQKEIQQVGIEQNHHLAFIGGNNTSNYRVSIGFMDYQGVIINTNTKNFISNMNMNQDFFGGLVNCEWGMLGNILKNRKILDEQKTFYSAATFNPTFPNHIDPEAGGWDKTPMANQITNPLAWMGVNNRDMTYSLGTHARLVFNWNDDFKSAFFGAYTYSSTKDSQYQPTYVCAYGKAYRSERNQETLLANFTTSFKKKLGIHLFDFYLLGEIQDEIYSGFNTTVTNFSSDIMGYDNLSLGALRPWEGTGSFREEPHQLSLMGRVNYTLANRYFLNLNARTDASSKFGINRKWGFFPSTSLAWMVTEEEFMKKFEFINKLKFKIGYGLSGNQSGISSYNTLNLMYPNGVAPIGATPVVTLGKIRNNNPNLKWEVKHTFNIGTEMAFFNDRVLLSMDYYSSKTTDMLYNYDVSVPPFSFNTLLANLGSMRNTGTEIALGFSLIQKKDLELNVNVNMTFQQNKLLSLNGNYEGKMLYGPQYKAISKLNGAGFHGGYNNIVYQVVGQPLGVFYLPHCKGLVSDGRGGYKYDVADLDGDAKVNLEDSKDRYVAGQAMPKAFLGSNVSLRYKSFDLSVQVNGAFGHKIYNGTSLSYMNMNTLPDYNVLSGAPKQKIQDQTATDYWLEKGDYLNFDYVTLGWNVPLNVNVQKYIHALRLTMTVDNLATITGYTGLTPIINSTTVDGTLGLDDKNSYPPYRTFTFGLSVNF